MQAEIATDHFSETRFSTNAWKAPLTKPLLAQMEEGESNDLRRAYDLANEAERYRSQLMEALKQEVGSAERGRCGEYRTALSRTLDDLLTKMRKHLARVGKREKL